MKPVRIKYYGLFWMTRRTYYIMLAAAAVLALVAMLGASLTNSLPPIGWPWFKKPIVKENGFRPFIINHFYFIILVCFVCQAVDTLMILRAFAKKEAEQRAGLGDLDSHEGNSTPVLTDADRVQNTPGVHPVRQSSNEHNS